MSRWLLACVVCAVLVGLAGCAGCPGKDAAIRDDGPELWDNARILKQREKHPRPVTPQEKKALASPPSIPCRVDGHGDEEVRLFLQYFATEQRGTMDRWLSRAKPYLSHVRAVLASFNLPPDLIVLPFVESGYSPMAVSPAGAGGMWQFMPATARRFGLTVDWWLDERRDPYKSTVAAAKYLGKLHQLFGDWNLALAAYNAGEGKIARAMAASGRCDFFDMAGDPALLAAETRHYVPKFLAMLKIFKNLEALGFPGIDWNIGAGLREVTAPGGTDLLALAQACGLAWEQFQVLNPAFRRQVSPPDLACTVYVPAGRQQAALAFLATPSAGPSGSQTAVAQAGDTWWGIAHRAGMPVAELRRLNAALPDTLPPGRTVRLAHSATVADAVADTPDGCSSPVQAQAPDRAPTGRPARGTGIGAIARRYPGGTRHVAAAAGQPFAGRSRGDTTLARTAPPPAVPLSPAAGTYVVQPGDTLFSISQRLRLDPKELVSANKQSLTRLSPGDTLTIPEAAKTQGPPRPL